MRVVRLPLTTILLVASTLFAIGIAPRPVRAAPSDDPWFGRDKALHFGLSMGLSATGYGLGVGSLDGRAWGLLVGGSVGLGAGLLKEGADLAGLGHPSWKDLAWDLAGVAVGLGIALCIDLAARGTSASWTRRPAALERSPYSRGALPGNLLLPALPTRRP